LTWPVADKAPPWEVVHRLDLTVRMRHFYH
jgi:hypothetical protein